MPSRQFLHRGIAARQFQRSFLLADGVEVKDAVLEHGMLVISVVRPKARKARPPHRHPFCLERGTSCKTDQNKTSFDNPLRHLTAGAVHGAGRQCGGLCPPDQGREADRDDGRDGDEVDADEEFQLVVSADGSPLLVADSEEAVDDWLSDKNFGIVALH